MSEYVKFIFLFSLLLKLCEYVNLVVNCSNLTMKKPKQCVKSVQS